jgi:alpha-galactosidase
MAWKSVTICLLVCKLIQLVLSINNGLAKTPPLGWSTWCTNDIIECFDDYCDEEEIRAIADAMVANGMKDAGYQYIFLDDCWAGPRDESGRLTADKMRFPSGSLKPIADYVHSKGLLLGAYTCAGNFTCKGKRPGSWGHFNLDAQTFASWGLDAVKVDWCHHPPLPPKYVYGLFRDALNKTGRRFLYSVCEWGEENPWEWGMQTANMWRVTGDHMPFFYLPGGTELGWSTQAIIEAFAGLSKYAGPGGWNDADFLMTGAITMTHLQSQTEFSFWALINSPLIVTTDIRDMSNKGDILLNREVININQDPLGIPGDRITSFGNGGEIWSKPLSNKKAAVILYNRNFLEVVTLTVHWVDIGYPPNSTLSVRDVWQHKDLGRFTNSFTATVEGHSVVMIIVSF